MMNRVSDSVLAELLARAERLVSRLKDERLREVAFREFLHLFVTENEPSAGDADEPSRHAASRHKPSAPAKGANPKVRGTMGRLLTLRDAGFFKNPKPIADVQSELRRHGHTYPLEALSTPLLRMVRSRELRRVEAKTGKKKVYHYCNP